MNADSTRQSILAVLAHPDDETFLIGGALALYARRGHDVRVLYGPFGTDAAGRPPPQRAAELSDAARALGLTDWSFLSPIGDDGPALTQGIFAELRWLRPRVVLTFDATGATGNPDHIAVGRAARDAVDALNTATAPEPPVRLYAIVFGRRQMSIALRLAALTRRAGGAALRPVPGSRAGRGAALLDPASRAGDAPARADGGVLLVHLPARASAAPCGLRHRHRA